MGLLNGRPSTADTHDITDNSDCPSIHFKLEQPLNRIHLLHITNIFLAPNSMQTRLNNPHLVDVHLLFQQDRPPLLL